MDAALNASELVVEEQQAAELADKARQRNAAKKARQKQRKHAQQAAALQEDPRLDHKTSQSHKPHIMRCV